MLFSVEVTFEDQVKTCMKAMYCYMMFGLSRFRIQEVVIVLSIFWSCCPSYCPSLCDHIWLQVKSLLKSKYFPYDKKILSHSSVVISRAKCRLYSLIYIISLC